MSKYNTYMNNHFDNCRLLATAYDEHRDRPVRIYMLPGVFDVVGITDGTDSWLGPVVADPFRINVRGILGEIQAGGDPRAVDKARSLPVPPADGQPRRRVLLQAPATQPEPRRRALLVQPAATPATATRKRLHAQ